jgi:hypothetical protein
MSSRSFGRFIIPADLLPLAIKVAHMDEDDFAQSVVLSGLFEDAGTEALASKSGVDEFEVCGNYATISSYERFGGDEIAKMFDAVGIPYTLDADAGECGEYSAFIRLRNGKGKTFDRSVCSDGRYTVSIDMGGVNPSYKPLPGELKDITAHARENKRLTNSIIDGKEPVLGIAAMYLLWKSEQQ